MRKVLLIFAILFSHSALAYTVQTRPGTQIFLTVPQDSKATVEFSEPVKTISGGKLFNIQPIGADVDERSRQIVDPQIFEVRPLQPDAEEVVTFVFPKRDSAVRTLLIRFRAKPATNGYYRVKLPSGAIENDAKGFLRSEKRLMGAMICDEDSFARQVLNQSVKVAGENDVDFTAVRRFEGNGLTGYVFLVSNKTSSSLKIDLNALKFGRVNQAVMANIDKETLEPCKFSTSTLIAQNPCQALLRIVVRGEQGFDSMTTREKGFPFVLQSKGDVQ